MKISRQRARAFTLIELLVVIAIIAILATLLAAALSRAKYSTKNSICRNNLHQMSIALQMYVTSYGEFPAFYNGYAPATPVCWFKTLGLPVQQAHVQMFDPVLGRYLEWYPYQGVFRCPLLTSRFGWPGFDPRTPDILDISYGYNAFGCYGWSPNGQPQVELGLSGPTTIGPSDGAYDVTNFYYLNRKESVVKSPFSMIALGDAFRRNKNPKLDAAISYSPVIGLWGAFTSETIPNNRQPGFLAHRGRCNRAFVDGHLEPEDLRKPFLAGGDDQLARWNTDNLPHRERLPDW
jgi:prepilin-type N-terminal cleavage/methylation domain-containing protein/prepilin-type processing-associated H-X9-DG protein